MISATHARSGSVTVSILEMRARAMRRATRKLVLQHPIPRSRTGGPRVVTAGRVHTKPVATCGTPRCRSRTLLGKHRTCG